MFFLAFNYGDPLAARGWAVPCATDIAFSLAVLRMLGVVHLCGIGFTMSLLVAVLA